MSEFCIQVLDWSKTPANQL